MTDTMAALFGDPNFRDKARRVLVVTYCLSGNKCSVSCKYGSALDVLSANIQFAPYLQSVMQTNPNLLPSVCNHSFIVDTLPFHSAGRYIIQATPPWRGVDI